MTTDALALQDKMQEQFAAQDARARQVVESIRKIGEVGGQAFAVLANIMGNVYPLFKRKGKGRVFEVGKEKFVSFKDWMIGVVCQPLDLSVSKGWYILAVARHLDGKMTDAEMRSLGIEKCKQLARVLRVKHELPHGLIAKAKGMKVRELDAYVGMLLEGAHKALTDGETRNHIVGGQQAVSIVGQPINFRGLIYSPMNEYGVVFLFGTVMENLKMCIEEIKPGFPDCIARRFTGKGWERVRIEFEFRSSNFRAHKHDPNGCDLIVCWEDDWKGCPPKLKVLGLREYIKSLPPKTIQLWDAEARTDKKTAEEYLRVLPEKVKGLFLALHSGVQTISRDICYKPRPRNPGVTYYSPERVFVYVDFQKSGLNLKVFTKGETMEGVKSAADERGGAKWGKLSLRDEDDLSRCLLVLKRSYDLIKDAIKNDERTSFYA